MIYAALKTVHGLSIVGWLGGMVFAHLFLRPAVATLEPPARLRLMHDVLGRFFQAVLLVSLLTLATGGWMLNQAATEVAQSGGRFLMPMSWTVMAALGVAMFGIYLFIRFSLYRRLSAAVDAGEWLRAGAALGQIRRWVLVNLVLGVVIVLATLLRLPG